MAIRFISLPEAAQQRFSEAFEKAKIDFAKANPALSDEEIGMQLGLPDPQDTINQFITASIDYRTGDREAAAPRLQKYGQQLMKLSQFSPELFEYFPQGTFESKSPREIITTAAEGKAVPFEPLLGKTRDQLTEDLRRHLQFASIQGLGGATSISPTVERLAPMSEEEQKRRIETGAFEPPPAVRMAEDIAQARDLRINRAIASLNPSERAPIYGTPEQIEEYNRVYGIQGPSPASIQNPQGIRFEGDQRALRRGSRTFTGKEGAAGSSGLERGAFTIGQPPSLPSFQGETPPTMGVTIPPVPAQPSISPASSRALRMQNLKSDIGETKLDLSQLGEQMKASPVIYAAYAPRIQQLMSRLNNQDDLTVALMATLPDIEEERKKFEAGKGIEIKQREQEELAISKEAARVKIEAAEIARDQAKIARDLVQINTELAVHQQLQKNIEDEIHAKETLFAAGLLTDSRGLQNLARVRQSGTAEVNRLLSVGNLQLLQANIPVTRTYFNDTAGAINEYEAQRAIIRKETDDLIAEEDGKLGKREDDRNTALRDILKGEEDRITKAEDALAIANESALDKMIEESNRHVNNERLDRQSAMQDLKWYKDTFGSDIPKGINDDLKRRLPDVDVDGILAGSTLEEKKMVKRSVGGTIGLSFSRSSMIGRNPPTFEQFILEKEKGESAKGGLMFDTSKEAMEDYRKEYDAIIVSTKELDPVQIQNEFNDKKKYLGSVFAMKDAKITLDEYLKNGDNETARWFVDGIGKPLTRDELDLYKAAATIKTGLNEMAIILEKIKGKIGVIQGPIWAFTSEHVNDDPDYRKLMATRATILSLTSRTFGERGVLTDTDIKRINPALLDVDMSHEGAIAALRQSNKMLGVNIQNSINLDRAAGRAVRDVADAVSSIIIQPLDLPQEFSAPSVEDQDIDEFLSQFQ